MQPAVHSWKLVCDEPGLMLDEQIANVLGRLSHARAALRDLAAIEVLQIVRYLDDKDGEEGDWQHRLLGWGLNPELDETLGSDGLLIGRRTYDSFAGAWPQREGPFAEKLNSMPKFVVSTTLGNPEWNNTTVLDSGDATVQVRRLKQEFEGELQVPGSHRLVQELIESDLVDRVNLMVFPVILGTGKKVFEETSERRNLRLTESRVVGDGVLALSYERAA